MRYKKKNNIIVVVILIVLIGLIWVLTWKKELHMPEDDTSIVILTEKFNDAGFDVYLEEYPKSRSENFSYTRLPIIMLIDEEELFIFQYDSKHDVLKNIKATDSQDAASTYYSDYNIFLYRGNNEKITTMLESNLNTLE